jgi:hypothetical protein
LDVGVTLDFGIAVLPQDGDQKSELLGIADERLYALKHATRTPSRVIPLESHTPRETAPVPPAPRGTAAPPPSAPPRNAPPSPPPSLVPPPAQHSERRKWERVSLAGTKAHAILSDAGQKTSKVIDLSYGGVALQLDNPDDLPNQFNAVLNVPILPPVRVVLRKAYALRIDGGRTRVGCSFVS